MSVQSHQTNRNVFHSSAGVLQSRVAGAQQVVLQQPGVLRRQPSLPERVRQPVPLLLLQDDGDVLAAGSRRRQPPVRRRPRPHHTRLQHVLVHQSHQVAGVGLMSAPGPAPGQGQWWRWRRRRWRWWRRRWRWRWSRRLRAVSSFDASSS